MDFCRFISAILIGGLLFSAAVAGAENRVALVIGNGDYPASPLTNAVNDARDIAAVLEDCGFEIILETNQDRAGMREAVRAFGGKIRHGGTGLFFYAGHGVQVDGANYMIPVNADVRATYDIDDQCLKMSYVLAAMEAAENDLNIIILDACRNNPFRSFRSVSQGLAMMDAPRGAYLAFATRPGALSGDGTGRNGLYTSKLLKHIRTPGLSLVDLFMRVRNDVLIASNGAQEPWDNHSLRRHFYFVPDGSAAQAQSSDDRLAEDPAGLPDEDPTDGTAEDSADGEVWDETDLSEDYYKEVVVEIHDGEPVEVVYYWPKDPSAETDETGTYDGSEWDDGSTADVYPEYAYTDETEDTTYYYYESGPESNSYYYSDAESEIYYESGGRPKPYWENRESATPKRTKRIYVQGRPGRTSDWRPPRNRPGQAATRRWAD